MVGGHRWECARDVNAAVVASAGVVEMAVGNDNNKTIIIGEEEIEEGSSALALSASRAWNRRWCR